MLTDKSTHRIDDFENASKFFFLHRKLATNTLQAHILWGHFELFCQHRKSLLRFKQGTQPRAWVAATSTEGFCKIVKTIARKIGTRMEKCLVFATHVSNATHSAIRVPHTQRLLPVCVRFIIVIIQIDPFQYAWRQSMFLHTAWHTNEMVDVRFYAVATEPNIGWKNI